jgi:peptidoglycan/xylan/chitin deacetylase (PgdA/CDA1 family)
MALRPLAVSLVLAAALLGTSVMREHGSAVDGVPAGSAQPSPVAEAPTPSGSNAPPSPGSSAGPGPSTAPPSGGGVTLPRPPILASEKFRVWQHGSRDAKLVALTFDDGWSLDGLEDIVRILRAKQAPATFFPVARAVDRHPKSWRAIAEAGFPIAYHSWNHDNLSTMSAAKAKADIDRSIRLIERITRAPLFPAVRPPGGAYDRTLLRVAREAGMQAVVMWDVDTRDWTGRRPRSVYRAAIDAKPGSIILMHTDKANTVKALPKIIDTLRKRGYTLVTVGQLIGLPGAVPVYMPREQQASNQGR